ncbi:MAG: hypothetical protein A2593_02520 [Candidatus Moranbacteria bacterium RIFOXYD1_FULL_44_9]|nr:MAG: hypothetical protein A2593_02520 [Candidatus Moranbacteria bacterium RIFOXYD1_FULL_44_9]
MAKSLGRREEGEAYAIPSIAMKMEQLLMVKNVIGAVCTVPHLSRKRLILEDGVFVLTLVQ